MDDSHPFRSMSIGHPIPEIRRFQSLTLKLQCHGHRCGQMARSYSWPNILLTLFLFVSHQSDQQSLRCTYLKNLTLKHPRSRSWVRSKVKVTYSTQYSTEIFPSCFINRTNHSWNMVKIVFDLEKNYLKFCVRKFAKITVSKTTPSKSNQVITMTRAIKLPKPGVSRWVVLTLLCRQYCATAVTLDKVMERSSSTFPQTHIFFVPNI